MLSCLALFLAGGSGELPALEELVSQGDPEKLYTNRRIIGAGASGSVFVATDPNGEEVSKRKRRRTHKRYEGSYFRGVNPFLQVAVKKMVVEKQAKKDILINEIMIMQMCQHPNIVNYRDAFLVKGILTVRKAHEEG